MKIRFRYFVLALVVILVSSTIALKLFGATWTAISSDGFGYYAYLPSIFHYKDVTGKNLVEDLPTEWVDESKGRLILQDNGNYLNKYPIGVALLETPGYLVATAINNIFYQGSYDQYAGPYQVSVLVSGIVALFIGFYFLWKVLKSRFSEKVTYATLVVILLGTNIIHYTTYDVSFSHVFSFSLFAYLIYLIDDFSLDKKQWRYYLRIGLILGLIVAVRQTNAILGLVLLIPAVKLYNNFGIVDSLRKYWKQILVMLVSSFLVVFIQLLYWKLVTGNWFIFAYQGEYFDFANPQIYEVLFGFRKGLFLWSPLLLISIPGFYLMFKQSEKLRYLASFILLAQVYIVASWWAWSFGFSYGHRGFTEFLILLAIPMAYTLKWFFHRRNVVIYLGISIFLFLVVLNFNFMQLYWRGVLNPDGMTLEKYEKVFLKLCVEDIPGQGCEAIR